MKDALQRDINYMRISITDRCNYRCRYCMPEGCAKVRMEDILTYEEILQICRAAGRLGIVNYKVTGGEPLVRIGCDSFVRMLKELPDTRQVTLTTNGELLEEHLPALLAAGLDAVNISMDTLRADRFSFITGGGHLGKVQDALAAAVSSGLKTKVNCLIQKGFNEDEVEDFAAMAFEKGIAVRFIEMMPIGCGDPANGYSNAVLLDRLTAAYPGLTADDTVRGNGPAVYYHIPGQAGAVGLISALHGMFCSSCNRVRLSAQGQLKPCLCYEDAVDLKPFLADPNALEDRLREAVLRKPEQHCFGVTGAPTEHRLMAQIGG